MQLWTLSTNKGGKLGNRSNYGLWPKIAFDEYHMSSSNYAFQWHTLHCSAHHSPPLLRKHFSSKSLFSASTQRLKKGSICGCASYNYGQTSYLKDRSLHPGSPRVHLQIHFPFLALPKLPHKFFLGLACHIMEYWANWFLWLDLWLLLLLRLHNGWFCPTQMFKFMSGVTLLYFHKLDDHNLISTVRCSIPHTTHVLYSIPIPSSPLCSMLETFTQRLNKESTVSSSLDSQGANLEKTFGRKTWLKN